MHAALRMAKTARWDCPPNPAVGCVLVAPDGRVIGEGATQVTGGPHAEVMALRAAQAEGQTVAGATAYVTLEPCAHFGRTPPCADALVAAGVQRVVVALEDPNPLVAGQGIQRLRAAGIQVELGLLRAEARAINLGFLSRMIRRRPWVRSKIAMSLDGKTALLNGTSQWITGPEARMDGHRFRARAGAIVTGIGTVLADDPRLDQRWPEARRQPCRVVVDAHLRVEAGARILQPPGQVRLYAATSQAPREQQLTAINPDLSLHCLPAAGGQAAAVDLPAMLADLAEAGVNEVHLEAGPTLTGAMMQAQLVDELLLYVAPCLLGPGREMAQLPPLTALDGRVPLQWLPSKAVGADLRLRAIVQGHDDF